MTTTDATAPRGVTTISAETIAARIYEMFALVDRREAARTVDHCADDFVMSALGMSFDRAQYAALMAGREQAPYDTRHLIHNVRVVASDGGSTTVRYLATVHRLDHGDEFATISVADAEDRWVVTPDGRLLLAARDITPVFDGRPVDKRGL